MKQWIALFYACCISPIYAATIADTVFMNGNIYTANESNPHAEAVAINHDCITAVGSNNEIKKFIGSQTRVINLKGMTMLPGLTDSHAHFIQVGEREMTFNLENTKSLDDLLTKVKEKTTKTNPGEWITGSGWIETYWKPSQFPTRWDLDRVAPNNPVVLSRADLHSIVVNSMALKLSGITKETKNPFGGETHHDQKSGEPDGMLMDEARNLITSHIPATDKAHLEKAMILANNWSIAHGLTQVQEPSGSYDDVDTYQTLFREGKIKIRIYKAVSGPSADSTRLLHDGPIIEAFDHHFNLRTIKVVSDGALGSRGAALFEPYNDATNTRGFLRVDEIKYQAMLHDALKKGIQVQTHAIGDAANHFTLYEYTKALKAVPPSSRQIANPRFRIEHAQILSDADLKRFAALNVIPSMQPSHAISDLHYASNRLGMKRLKNAYAWRSLIKTGVIIPGGSDAPVERGDTLIEFYAAVARKDIHGFSSKGWHREQILSRDEALKMFTVWPAYAAFEENLRGQIAPGKLADFTVLSKDIMKVPSDQILKSHNVMTVIGGEIVWQEMQRS